MEMGWTEAEREVDWRSGGCLSLQWGPSLYQETLEVDKVPGEGARGNPFLYQIQGATYWGRLTLRCAVQDPSRMKASAEEVSCLLPVTDGN